MADVAALTKAAVAADDALAALIVTRRSNRDSKTKAEFRDYNESTRAQQLQVQRDADAASKALSDSLNVDREHAAAQVISVGTLHETNRSGGVS